MRKTSISTQLLEKGLFAGFLLIAIFAVLFGGVAWVRAGIGTACGDATGTGATVSVAAGITTITDLTKSWKPNPDRWKDGTVTITSSTVAGDIGKKGTVTGSTATTITVSSWIPTGNPTGTLAYAVTAKANACKVGERDYSCVQAGDIGFCKGPCAVDSACNVFLAGGVSSLNWVGTQCTGTPGVAAVPGTCVAGTAGCTGGSAGSAGPPLVPAVPGTCVAGTAGCTGGSAAVPEVNGVCVELPSSASSLSDTALVTSGTGLLTLVNVVTNWIFAVFTVLTIIFVLLAAFQFVTAGGQAEKVGEARMKLIWAAVGIIIALLAKGLVPVIRTIVGG